MFQTTTNITLYNITKKLRILGDICLGDLATYIILTSPKTNQAAFKLLKIGELLRVFQGGEPSTRWPATRGAPLFPLLVPPGNCVAPLPGCPIGS